MKTNVVVIYGEEEFLVERSAHESALSCLSKIIEYKIPDDINSFICDTDSYSETPRAFLIQIDKEIPNFPKNSSDNFIFYSKKKPSLVGVNPSNIIEHPKLKTFDDKNEVIKWIISEGNRYNIDLSRVSNSIFMNCGDNLRKISSEIDKLSYIVQKGHRASPDDIRLSLVFSNSLDPSGIIDSIKMGDVKRAVSIHDKMQSLGEETGWIISYLFKFVSNLYISSILSKIESNPDDIAQKIGIHPFVYKKSIHPYINLWDKSILFESSSKICECDFLHKNGKEISKFLLVEEIMRLCRERRSV
jgi:DNA polymerase III delta subunit